MASAVVVLALAAAPPPARALAQDAGGPAGDAPPASLASVNKAPAVAAGAPAAATAETPLPAAGATGNKGSPGSAAPTDAAPAPEGQATDAPATDAQDTGPLDTGALDTGDNATDARAADAMDDAEDAAAHSGQREPGPAGIAAQLADWVRATDDNGKRPFVIVDKLSAKVFVFSARGRLLGSAPALVGLAPGDDSADGIGERALSQIGPEERTTPAGRFVAEFGAASGHRRVLWVDYAHAISLHPVVTSNPKEHRLTRIKSQEAEDHRISYGCINVPATFYERVVLKALAGGTAVVYVLPDTRPIEEVFPAFAATVRAGGGGAAGRNSTGVLFDAPSLDAPQETGTP